MVAPSAMNGGPRNKYRLRFHKRVKNVRIQIYNGRLADNRREPNKERMLTLDHGKVHDY